MSSGIASREDDLRPLRAGAHLGDDGLDAAPLLVALAVHLLGAREQRLDATEVDEDVVAVARLLDDPGHDLALAIDVLLVHDRPLGLADPLLDDLLRGLRGDPAEVVRRHVRAHDLVRGYLRPVELEVIVGDERVLALPGLLLELLELGDARLARLLDEPLLDVAGDVDPVDAELARVVELHLGMPGCARRLLVGGAERVLECRDEDALLDALLLLDLVDALDDLLAHVCNPSSIRLARTMEAYGMRTVRASAVSSMIASGPASVSVPR